MNPIEFENGAVCVDAKLIAECFEVDVQTLQAKMREGKVTSLCERGLDEDAGRWRISFFYGDRRLRLVVDAAGAVVQRTLDQASGRGARKVEILKSK